MKLLLGLDPNTYTAMVTGDPPRVPYSHDRTLLLMGHEALAKGHSVYASEGIQGLWDGRVRRIKNIFPGWSYEEAELTPSSLDALVSAGVDQLTIKKRLPRTKLIGVLSALHMFESPGLHGPSYSYNLFRALRDHVDLVITLNERMKETLETLAWWLGNVDVRDRIVVVPLSISRAQVDELDGKFNRTNIRRDMNLATTDTLFVNAGGAWGWTDCDTFLEAVCRYLEAKGSGVRVYFSGITQEKNYEYNPVAENIKNIMSNNPSMFADKITDKAPIYIERNWSTGGKDIWKALIAGDVGIHVNKNTFESWQSHRVRFIDYLHAGLSILSTRGDLTSSRSKECCFFSNSGDVESYLGALNEIRSTPANVVSRKAAALRARNERLSNLTIGPVIDMIENLKINIIDMNSESEWYFDELVNSEGKEFANLIRRRIHTERA
jgi:hypothetical protein